MDVRKDVINPILCVLVLPSSTPFLVLIGNLGSNSPSLCYGYCPMWIDGSGGGLVVIKYFRLKIKPQTVMEGNGKIRF